MTAHILALRLLPAVIAVSAGAVAAQPIVLASTHPTQNGQFALSLDAVPDVTGDGRDDVVIGAVNEVGSDGYVYLFSGATGALVRELTLAGERAGLGKGVAGVPDVNGDGFGEIAAGTASGRALLFDGATGAFLREFSDPGGTSGTFGHKIAGVPDVSGDGSGDVVVGAYAGDDFGRAFLFDGATGVLLHTLRKPEDPEGRPFWFGWSLDGLADVSGDGRGDVLVGAPNPGSARGRAFIFDGANGTLLHVLPEDIDSAPMNLGISVASVPDLSGDGRPDVVAGSQLGQRAVVFNGATGAALRSHVSPYPDPFDSYIAYYSIAVAGLADFDKDGRGDVLIMAPYEDPDALETQIGIAYIHSGSDGRILRELRFDAVPNDIAFGNTAVGLGDVDGDGRGDFVVGAYTWRPEGSAITAGRAYLYHSSRLTLPEAIGNSIVESVPPRIEHDTNGDLVVDAADLTDSTLPSIQDGGTGFPWN